MYGHDGASLAGSPVPLNWSKWFRQIHRWVSIAFTVKPPLLYERAAAEHGIDLPSSFVIGDSPEDMLAASRLGARGCLVRTGWAADPRVLEDGRADAAFVADSIVEAADWIVARGERPGSEPGA